MSRYTSDWFFVQGLTRPKSRCCLGLILFWGTGVLSSWGCGNNSVFCICRVKVPTFLLAISRESLSVTKGCLPFPATWPLLYHGTLLPQGKQESIHCSLESLCLLLFLTSRPFLKRVHSIRSGPPRSRRRDYIGHAHQRMGILQTSLGFYLHTFLTIL